MYFIKKYKRGVFNKYRKGMPVLEMLMKDLNYSFLALKNYVKNRFKNKVLLVYPHYPSRGSTLYKVGKMLNYNITNKIEKKISLAVYWEYLTFRKEFDKLETLTPNKTVVNLHSRDISKVFVDKAFADVFGYQTIVNPLTFSGKVVKKNDINAKHDGQIIQAPINEQDFDNQYIYQILIDNSCEDNCVEDIRVPIVKETLDFVYLKRRPISERFKNTTVKTQLTETQNVFSSNEIEQLNKFCKLIKLDYGELDVLRHKTNGKIYVVDVNNTPQGPPANTPKEDAQKALQTIAQSLVKAFV